MQWFVSLWHVYNLAFVMQVVTVVAALLWRLVLCKGQAFMDADISVPSKNAQMKVCPCSPGALAFIHAFILVPQH